MQIPKSIDYRQISVQNATDISVGFRINFLESLAGKQNENIVLDPGKERHLGIHSLGACPRQFIQIVDPQSGVPVSKPFEITSSGNQLVLRKSSDGWYVEYYRRPVYSPLA